ncbi:MAG: hypothetical protein AUG07_05770 [Acidobacteria bacterium 13_1_20CM_2_60_10]|nr:MAG: hypothetical protein AUG07_05770 [Acidobacteria bacterium 13_1_20CM_2_60_10]
MNDKRFLTEWAGNLMRRSSQRCQKALPYHWEQIIKIAIAVDLLQLLQAVKQVRQPPHRAPLLLENLLDRAFRNSA